MGKFKELFSRKRTKGGSSQSASSSQIASPAGSRPAVASGTCPAQPSSLESPPLESPPPETSPPESSPHNLQGRLWNQAYDGVKTNEPKIAEAFEKLVSAGLQKEGIPPLPSSNTIRHTERGRQMAQLIEIGLQRTEKATAVKTKVGDGLKTVMTVKSLVSSAVQAVPAAAVAWIGVSFALDILSNSLTESSANREGLTYVVSQMEWYWNLVRLLLDTGAKTELHGLRDQLERQILELYQELLLYQMKSVCLYHQNQGVVFLKDMIKFDDWKSHFDKIKDAEADVRKNSKQYNSQQVQARLFDLATTADLQYNALQNITFAVEDQTHQQKQMHRDEKDERCLQSLCITDPEKDKVRIQNDKGGLLRDSYIWILNNPDFEQWRTLPNHGLLWIRGDPGKGKTMLICGILDELEKHQSNRPAYFFCQETDGDLNNATAVLRGLMFSLVRQQPKLISHVRKEYDAVGQKLFEGNNVWVAMSKILTAMLSDPNLSSVILVVDALDECKSSEDRSRLLKLIVVLSESPRVKWIVSSRNWPDIQEQLDATNQKISLRLELNEDSISTAVKAYIGHKVGELARLKKYDEKTRATVHQTFVDKADNTFLWVALVYDELSRPHVSPWRTLETLGATPSGLYPLYERMLRHITESDDKELRTQVLALVSVVYRPVSLQELAAILELPPYFDENPQALDVLIASCGSFLSLQGNLVAFVHQSAKDFLLRKETVGLILPHGMQHQHRTIFSRSIKVLSQILHRDIYQLKEPGASVDTSPPNPDPLAPVRYSCVYWVDHLDDADIATDLTQQHIQDGSTLHVFLQRKYLYWLEAASLNRSIPEAVAATQKVESLTTRFKTSQQLLALVRDSLRFVRWCKGGIEVAPLQLYASAILFCPRKSLVSHLFKSEAFAWISSTSQMPADWDACEQTLEGHCESVTSVAFAPDGQRLASASGDKTVKIWDLVTGSCIVTLDHDKWVNSVAFAPDGQRLVSASNNVKVWDPATGVCKTTFQVESQSANVVALSPDGQRLASGSNNVKIWDLATNVCITTLDSKPGNNVTALAFAPDGKRLASSSDLRIVRAWDVATGECIATLSGHTANAVTAVAFAPDGHRLASASSDHTVKVWDPARGVCLATLEGHDDWANSVAFTPDGQRLASASGDGTVKLWDTATGACIGTFKGHTRGISAVAFAPDGQQLASGSNDNTVKVWNPAASIHISPLEDHSKRVMTVAFLPDGQRLASASIDGTIKLWNPITGLCIATLDGHNRWAVFKLAVTVAPDGHRLASVSFDGTVKVWEVATSVCIATLKLKKGSLFDFFTVAIAFAPDGERLVSASDNGSTVEVWDLMTGGCVETLENPLKLDRQRRKVKLELSSTSNFDLSAGYYNGDLLLHPWATDHDSQQICPRLQRSLGLAMSHENDWITKDSQKVLWLPSEYRPTRRTVAVAGSVLAAGCLSGRVMFYIL